MMVQIFERLRSRSKLKWKNILVMSLDFIILSLTGQLVAATPPVHVWTFVMPPSVSSFRSNRQMFLEWLYILLSMRARKQGPYKGDGEVWSKQLKIGIPSLPLTSSCFLPAVTPASLKCEEHMLTFAHSYLPLGGLPGWGEVFLYTVDWLPREEDGWPLALFMSLPLMQDLFIRCGHCNPSAPIQFTEALCHCRPLKSTKLMDQ